MAIETASHISELDPSTIDSGTDPKEGGAQVNLVKTILLTDLGGINAPVTATSAELNTLAGTTPGTAAPSKALTPDAGGNLNASSVTWNGLGTVNSATINGATVSSIDINGGTIDGTVIGGSAIAAGSFNDLSSTTYELNGYQVTHIDDDGTLALNSSTRLPTQRAVKQYADSLDFATEAYVNDRVYFVTSVEFPDVASLDDAYISMPGTGIVERMDVVMQNALTGGDTTVTLFSDSGATMLSFVIDSTFSAPGAKGFTETIAFPNVTKGDALHLTTDGVASGASKFWCTFTIKVAP